MSNEYVDFEKTGKHYYVKVVPDDNQENPREDQENFGIMACVRNHRYNFGDKDFEFSDPNEFLRNLAAQIDPTFEDTVAYWEDGVGWARARNTHGQDSKAVYKMVEDKISKRMWDVLNKGVILPLFVYEHSGIAMNTRGFSCPWDSGQVGYIYATPEMIRKEYGVKIVTKSVREKVTKLLEAEVETYHQWLSGDVWGIVVEDMYGDVVESCWGYYGDAFAKEEALNWLAATEKNGRVACTDTEFKRMKAHEADLRKAYRALMKSGVENNPIILAGILENAAKVQKERMALRATLYSDHFAEEA